MRFLGLERKKQPLWMTDPAAHRRAIEQQLLDGLRRIEEQDWEEWRKAIWRQPIYDKLGYIPTREELGLGSADQKETDDETRD